MEELRQSLLNVIRRLASENNELRQDYARQKQDLALVRLRVEETGNELIQLHKQNVKLVRQLQEAEKALKKVK